MHIITLSLCKSTIVSEVILCRVILDCTLHSNEKCADTYLQCSKIALEALKSPCRIKRYVLLHTCTHALSSSCLIKSQREHKKIPLDMPFPIWFQAAKSCPCSTK